MNNSNTFDFEWIQSNDQVKDDVPAQNKEWNKQLDYLL